MENRSRSAIVPVIEREFHLLSAKELEGRFDVLRVPLGCRRARFFHGFYPIYDAIDKGAPIAFSKPPLEETPEQGPRRIHRPSRNVETIVSEPAATLPPVERQLVVVQSPAPQVAMTLTVALSPGYRAEYHVDGRLLITRI